ncbi:MAG TPA: hemolysin family protein [Opitutaceae bacterium]
MADISTELVILGLLLLLNALMAMAEVSLASARKSRLRELADDGDAGAKIALELVGEPTRVRAAVQLAITVVAILAGAIVAVPLAARLEPLLAMVPTLAAVAGGLSLGVVILILACIWVGCGELIPKRLALHRPERVATLLARPARTASRVLGPVIGGLGWLAALLLKPFGLRDRPREAPVSDEEVNTLIEQGLSAGVFNKAEKEMVAGVLELDQLPVTALMTPRPKIVFLNLDDAEETNWRKIVASGHSHFPVYQNNRDHVLGMVAVKAIWANQAFGLATNLRNLLTPPVVVPETMTAIQLLEQFRKSGKHVALVADEFGAMQGLVTLIDVFEAIVGALPEPGQRAAPAARQREDGSWLIDATLGVDEVKTMLALDELPHEDEVDFQTLGGFVMTHFGRIPAAGDYFEWGGWRFEVVDMDRHRIDKVLVAKAAPPAELQKAAS